MKKLITLISLTIFAISAGAQNTAVRLCDFDTVKHVVFSYASGKLDTNFVNPMTTGINTSARCARYIRDTAKYDNIQMHALWKFIDISQFAQANTLSKMSLMVMSNMPAGSRIDIQLGSRQYNTYPAGIHSVYTGTTTLTGQWEMVSFSLTDNLSATNGFPFPGSIDKMIVLFRPNSNSTDTIYFDEVMGPAREQSTSLQKISSADFTLSQNWPNPAGISTSVKLELPVASDVKMTVYDMLGNEVARPINKKLEAGEHSVTIETEKMSDGIYFYTFEANQTKITRRMVVAK